MSKSNKDKKEKEKISKSDKSEKIDIINYKKTKVTMLKYLEMGFIMKDMKLSVFEKKIPASTMKYHIDLNGNHVIDKLNLYKHNSYININTIKYIKITTKKDFIEKIDLANYKFNGRSIKVTKPTYKTDIYETVGLVMPIEIFKVLLKDIREMNYRPEPTRLSAVLTLVNSPFDIKLLDKNKKSLGFALIFSE